MTTQLIVLFLLILVNALFSMSEMALVSSRKARLRQMAEDGDKGARRALALADDPSRFLSTVQIGITLVNVLVGAFGTATLSTGLADTLRAIPALAPAADSLAIAIVVVAISYFSLIIGELAPKRLALAQPERISTAFAAAMSGMQVVAAPAVWFLSVSTDLALRLVPVPTAKEPPVTDEEIKFMMREGAEAGHFHAGETAIVEMALRLGDRRVSALMVPRTRMTVLDLQDPMEENRAQILKSPHSRLPVVDGDDNNVVGILQVKDLVAAALGQDAGFEDFRALLKPPLFIPDTAPALRALEIFKASGSPLALIVDEYGDIQGLVTPNDILTALVGDIAEPGGEEEPEAVRRPDGSWLISGMMPIDEACDLIGLARARLVDGEDDSFQTLGGLMMARLKRIPQPGDSATVSDFRFEVVAMDGRRVDKVSVVPPAAPPG